MSTWSDIYSAYDINPGLSNQEVDIERNIVFSGTYTYRLIDWFPHWTLGLFNGLIKCLKLMEEKQLWERSIVGLRRPLTIPVHWSPQMSSNSQGNDHEDKDNHILTFRKRGNRIIFKWTNFSKAQKKLSWQQNRYISTEHKPDVHFSELAASNLQIFVQLPKFCMFCSLCRSNHWTCIPGPVLPISQPDPN